MNVNGHNNTPQQSTYPQNGSNGSSTDLETRNALVKLHAQNTGIVFYQNIFPINGEYTS